MDLSVVIRELLYLEDCVIIPGFGGFVTNYLSARVLRENNTFLPPAKEIGFNSELVHDDGTLTRYTAARYDLSEAEARQKLNAFIQDIQKRMAQGDRVFLEGIGSFALDLEGKPQFSADLGVNFLVDSFGLSPFHFRELKAQHEGAFSRSPLFRQEAAPVRTVLPGSEGPKTISRHQVAKVAIAIPALVILSLIPFNARVTQVLKKHPANLAPLPSLYRLDYPVNDTFRSGREITYPYTDSLPATYAEPVSQGPEEQKKTPVVTETPVVQLPVSSQSYPIIAGSFQSELNARKLSAALAQRGHTSSVMLAENGYYRVTIASFNNLSEAERALPQLRERESSLKLWILR